jgi:hypothetical protein
MLGLFSKRQRQFSQIISILQRAELQLEMRANQGSPLSSADRLNPAALMRELHQYEAVDGACREIAKALGLWLKRRDQIGVDFPILPQSMCEPALYRVRDALRLLLECKAIPPEFSVSDGEVKLFEELLVDRWHVYAERYWKQRWVRTSLGAATS